LGPDFDALENEGAEFDSLGFSCAFALEANIPQDRAAIARPARKVLKLIFLFACIADSPEAGIGGRIGSRGAIHALPRV
jgi:hypothetical protein